MLAGLVQSPTNDDPIDNPENAQIRRNQVLERMHTLGHITDQELAEISPQPVAVAPGVNPPNGCIDAALGGFFCAYLMEYLTGTLGLTTTEISNGGLTIQTTLRPDMQAAGDQAVLNTLPMGDPLAAMYTAVEPGTGHVLAMSVNRRYGCERPRVRVRRPQQRRPARAPGRPTRSSRPRPRSRRASGPALHDQHAGNPYTSRVYRGPACGTRPQRHRAAYCVENAGNYPDTLDMVGALVRLVQHLLPGAGGRAGQRRGAGPHGRAHGHALRPAQPEPGRQIIAENRGSFTLGAEATSPLDLANAYATLGAQGTRCDADAGGRRCSTAPASRSRREDGAPLVTETTAPRRRSRSAVANTLSQILVGDVSTPAGTGTRAAIPGHQIAGKTGTVAGQRLRRLRRLHAAVRRQRHGLQPQGEAERRRLRWQHAGDDLARRDGADPHRPGGRAVPAGGPGPAQRRSARRRGPASRQPAPAPRAGSRRSRSRWRAGARSGTNGGGGRTAAGRRRRRRERRCAAAGTTVRAAAVAAAAAAGLTPPPVSRAGGAPPRRRGRRRPGRRRRRSRRP